MSTRMITANGKATATANQPVAAVLAAAHLG